MGIHVNMVVWSESLATELGTQILIHRSVNLCAPSPTINSLTVVRRPIASEAFFRAASALWWDFITFLTATAAWLILAFFPSFSFVFQGLFKLHSRQPVLVRNLALVG
ncbi:hypothetical protein BDV36DRAFT_214254 [Aspergillus pseudocaelatus]|uniref:Uncharacterized protein n=1 Tax=Aspergillus pseudocaelatus TaxID=1825620 RepID=A0ABQ6WG05_9EURO|nr:hypothetical protein BDV36DRAFT_214254 [Aspergillus pseudocaelatus]